MNKNKTIKILTLTGFVILLTGFIAFKAGTFNKYLRTESAAGSPHTGQLPQNEGLPLDTPPVKPVDTSILSPSMLPTSKSGIIIDQKLKFPINDTIKKESKKQAPKN